MLLLYKNPGVQKQTSTGLVTILLRILSALSLASAFFSEVALIAFRLLHWLKPQSFPWTLQSAVPLILVGTSFACLQFATTRTRNQIFLGLTVAAAFILWGSEQYMSDRALVAFIDDVVVFLFVLDLSIVIYNHLKRGPQPESDELPFDAPAK